MAATLQVSYYGGASTEPAGSSAESTGLCMNREDSRSGTTGTIPIPTTTAGTNFSFPKLIALQVVTSGTTTIDNRQVARSSACPAGLVLYWTSSSGYVQPTTFAAANTTADDATPGSTYTALTTSYVGYSTYSTSAAAGRNGAFCKLVLGVSSTGTYTGGAGSAIVLPNILVSYDEA